jgi:hypothetical protein
MNTTRAKAERRTIAERWALALVLSMQLHTVHSDESRPSAPAGPLPLTCEAPATKNSALTIRIQLTAEAFGKVVFDHPKPQGLPTGVVGQSMICTCVDTEGNIKNPVKLLRASGSPQLDAEALEIGKTLSYPTGHPGCMHDTVNFAAP